MINTVLKIDTMAIKENEFGENVRRKREALGLSQVALAKKIKVTNVTLNRWESGVVVPSAAMQDHVLRVLAEQR